MYYCFEDMVFWMIKCAGLIIPSFWRLRTGSINPACCRNQRNGYYWGPTGKASDRNLWRSLMFYIMACILVTWPYTYLCTWRTLLYLLHFNKYAYKLIYIFKYKMYSRKSSNYNMSTVTFSEFPYLGDRGRRITTSSGAICSI